MLPPLGTTGIGSLPHTDPEAACDLVFRQVDIPFWPQLPRLSPRESMLPQYIDGFPFTRLEGADVRVVEPTEEALFAFYDAVEAGEGFAIPPEAARGFEPFERRIARSGPPLAKGQITGPVTFTLGISDEAGKPLFFDEEKRELALALLKGKALWQIRRLSRFADKVVLFMDEPILSALGTSTYLGVDEDEAARLLRETARAIAGAGGIPAIHCCSKAHWPLVAASGVEILNFDAWDHADSLGLYPDEVRRFVEGGGRIAWGVVPTTEAIDDADERAVLERLRRGIERLAAIGVDRESALRQSLLTPSCGAGSLSVEQSEKVFRLLRALQAEARSLWRG